MLRHQLIQQSFAQRSEHFIDGVNAACREFLSERHRQVSAVSAAGEPLADAVLDLTSGGKKLRPVLAWIGWRGARGRTADERVSAHSAPAMLGVALELFQAAALIHDDVIDRSDTRRGRPSTHRRFEALHREKGFTGDAAHFGTTGAILSGDLSLAWAAQAFAAAQRAALSQHAVSPQGLQRVQQLFEQMHTEVMAGQYLDVHAEVAPSAGSEEEALALARNVLRYKAAKYSSEYPVILGCALAGGSESLQDAFAAVALPVGEAFQLRDDLLGVFGDPAVTGKPVGDDLREGKRTELIAYGLFRAPGDAAEELHSMLGRADLTDSDVHRARQILREAGAQEEVERSIAELLRISEDSLSRLREFDVEEEVITDLTAVTQRLVSRTS